MTKESFVLYKSFYEPIKHLTKELKGELLDAIFQFQTEGLEPLQNNPIYMAFMFFKNQFRLDEEKYQKIVERNRTNGAKGGRPPNEIPEVTQNPVGYLEPKKADKEKDNVNDNDYLLCVDEFSNENPQTREFQFESSDFVFEAQNPLTIAPEEKSEETNKKGAADFGLLSETASTNAISKNREVKTKSKPESVGAVKDYMLSLGSKEAEEESNKFFDHFSSNGWKVGGKAAMKDWQAAVRNWLKNAEKFRNKKQFVNPLPENYRDRDRRKPTPHHEFSGECVYI